MNELDAIAIGRRIAQSRRETGGMTQEQLAELLNVSARSVQDYERGLTIPWKHFRTLEEIFTHSLGWFLHGEEDPASRRVEDALADLRREMKTLTAELRRAREGLPPQGHGAARASR